MIELMGNELTLRFPEVHPDAIGYIDFKKTLRVPDDGREHPLPAGFERFHLEHIEDHADRVPAKWLKRGGVLLPMHQSEALWINLSGMYPMAIKIATGKINAVTGEPWTNSLSDEPQDYVVLSEQPWLDGYAVEQGTVRQFVARELGRGETVEEQITGEAEFGGIQIIAFPMKADVYKEHFETSKGLHLNEPLNKHICMSVKDMGIAPGGKIKQEIYEDIYGLDAWDLDAGSRCFIHTVNSEQWSELTGLDMPEKPLDAKEYQEADIPWFDYNDSSQTPLPGSEKLNSLKSIEEKIESIMGKAIDEPIELGPKTKRVSDDNF